MQPKFPRSIPIIHESRNCGRSARGVGTLLVLKIQRVAQSRDYDDTGAFVLANSRREKKKTGRPGPWRLRNLRHPNLRHWNPRCWSHR